MNRHALYHCGLDRHGSRHWRMKSALAARNCRQQATLFPKVVVIAPPAACCVVWRNDLHRRRWTQLAALTRADRRSFLATLTHPALVSPLPPFG